MLSAVHELPMVMVDAVISVIVVLFDVVPLNGFENAARHAVGKDVGSVTTALFPAVTYLVPHCKINPPGSLHQPLAARD